MLIIPPTQESRRLATQALFPVDKFIRNINAKDFWCFPNGTKTTEAKNLLRHYVVEQLPIVDKRAASRAIRIEGKLMTVGPEVIWIRDDHLRNNVDKTTLICLAVPTPSGAQTATPSHESPETKQTLISDMRKVGVRGTIIDWAEKGFGGATAAVGEGQGTKPLPIKFEIGSVLQLDEHEELFVRPESEGICMVLFGHKHDAHEAGDG